MIAKDLLNNSIIAMSPMANAIDMLSWMEEYKVSHLPVVEGNQYIGLLAEDDLFNFDNPEVPVGLSNPYLRKIYVNIDQHIFEIIKLMGQEHLSLLPVLDGANKYEGVITYSTLIERFSSYTAVDQPGGIIVLTVSTRDYLASQIVQIIESNDAKLLSLFISTQPNSTSMDVNLKVNKIDISGIIQTFERYGYDIKGSWHDDNDNDLQDRYDSLMNFLSI